MGKPDRAKTRTKYVILVILQSHRQYLQLFDNLLYLHVANDYNCCDSNNTAPAGPR